MIRKFSFLAAAALALCTFGSRAGAQTQPITPLAKQLSKVDLAVSGAGQFNKTVTGNITPTNAPDAGQAVSDNASNTVGTLVTIRYIARPLVGLEFNYLHARYTENYSYPPPNLGVQVGANEYTLGYVATPAHPIFGLQPYIGAGLGTIEFKPTAGGGQSLLPQARAAYYYSLGVQDDLSPHFGVRAGFRQAFFLAPDFGQNYLTIKQHTYTSEPTLGLFLRF